MKRGFRWTLAALIACGWLLAAGAVRAQYWAEIGPGIELKPVADGERLALPPDDPLYAAAEAACRLTLDGLFRPDAGARRLFEIGWVESEDGGGRARLDEFEIVPLGEQAPVEIEPADYHFEGGEVLIGFGPDPEDEWGPYSVVSFFAGPEGRVEELARHECGAQYCYGIYALDMTADGVLELVVPWTTGFGSNGGVELFAVVPTGGFSAWGDDLDTGSFWSSHGYTELMDYDGDGDWELTAYFPLLFSAAGYSFTELLTFDPVRYEWIDAEQIAPELYQQQYAFYDQLLAVLEDFALDPAPYRVVDNEGWGAFVCEIDGEQRYLDAFTTDEEGTIDEYWLGVIRDYIAGWRGEDSGADPG